MISRLIIIVITKNDQKFFTDDLKKSEYEKGPDIPLRLLNNPPEKNALMRNPTSNIIIKPPEKYEIKLLKPASISA